MLFTWRIRQYLVTYSLTDDTFTCTCPAHKGDQEHLCKHARYISTHLRQAANIFWAQRNMPHPRARPSNTTPKNTQHKAYNVMRRLTRG